MSSRRLSPSDALSVSWSFGCALAVLPGTLWAQSFDPAVGALRAEWSMNAQVIRQAAELMPEEHYAYRPVETVRSFGQIIGHLIDTQNVLCAAAFGEPATNEPPVEKTASTKAALLMRLQSSMSGCSKAYLQNLVDSTLPRGEQSSRFTALVHNTAHNNEHYGNLATYLRLKGLIPPSTQP